MISWIALGVAIAALALSITNFIWEYVQDRALGDTFEQIGDDFGEQDEKIEALAALFTPHAINFDEIDPNSLAQLGAGQLLYANPAADFKGDNLGN